MEIKTYQKQNNVNLINLLKHSLKDIYKSHYLAKQLAIRDISAQYRQSYLGILWAFITPLTTALVWVFLNLTGTIKLTDTGIPYPVYAFTGALLWSVIADSIHAPMTSTKEAKSILSKINFPKEALLISGIYKLVFNSSIKVVFLLIFLLIFGVGFKSSLVWLPLTLLSLVLFGTTIGLLITPLGMLYNDIVKIVTMALSIIMYITPVVYAIPKIGLMKIVMEINPLTPLILTTRDLVVGLTPKYLSYYLMILVVCVPLLLLGLLLYRISIPIIVERMSG